MFSIVLTLIQFRFRFFLPERISTRKLHYEGITHRPAFLLKHTCLDSKTSIKTSATCRNMSGIALLVAATLVNAACLSVIQRNMSLSQIQYHGTLCESYS